jgi:asparagine synthase (glutamine-hydrolysing)
MCGIAGFLEASARNGADTMRERVGAMTDAMRLRGPDDRGIWADAAAGVAFGHRRLSVIDLSPTGRQPMQSANGRFVITYNGEVFNYPDLRDELAAAGGRFRGTSDTEVILEGCTVWGLERTVERLIGMFAIALWDRETRTLHLIRDRLGIKPLYWGRPGGGLLLFGSELKALRAHPAWTPEIDRDALDAFLRFGYVPAPRSIYRGVAKLEPGSILTVQTDALARGATPTIRRFWDLRAVAARGLSDRLALDDAAAADALDSLLRDAVRRRMIADVPLGAFLSGGIDSSTVVALMQAQSSRPVRTFSIGFREAGYDEAPAARAVARHLGTDHDELYVGPAEALATIPHLPHWFDEPFADSSQIPTHLVSAMARRHVTVALSGDGGDELFAGYNRHLAAYRLTHAAAVPAPLRRAAAGLLAAVPPARWDRAAAALLPSQIRPPQFGDKLHKLAALLVASDDAARAYRRLVTLWTDHGLVPGAGSAATALDDPALSAAVGSGGPVERFQLFDMATYLPDDILTKVDRASMAVALEARVPLLDHRVVEFAWRLPPSMRIRDGRSKWLLRRVLARYVPSSLTDRPKSGFALPIDGWLRGPLRDWAEDLLDPARLRREGYVAAEPVRAAWTAHLSGHANHQHRLWAVLMFQAWLERERAVTDAPASGATMLHTAAAAAAG